MALRLNTPSTKQVDARHRAPGHRRRRLQRLRPDPAEGAYSPREYWYSFPRAASLSSRGCSEEDGISSSSSTRTPRARLGRARPAMPPTTTWTACPASVRAPAARAGARACRTGRAPDRPPRRSASGLPLDQSADASRLRGGRGPVRKRRGRGLRLPGRPPSMARAPRRRRLRGWRPRLDAPQSGRRVCHGSRTPSAWHAKHGSGSTSATSEAFNRDYVIVASSRHLSAESYRSDSGGALGSRSTSIRCRRTPSRAAPEDAQPVAAGPETATVTGPKGEVFISTSRGG